MSGTILSMGKIFCWEKNETNKGGASLCGWSKAMWQSKLNVGLPLTPASWFAYSFSWQHLCACTNLSCRELMLHYVCPGTWHSPTLTSALLLTSCPLEYLILVFAIKTNRPFVQVSTAFWRIVNNSSLVLSSVLCPPHYVFISTHFWKHGLYRSRPI